MKRDPQHSALSLSSAEVSFLFPVGWGMGRRENKARGSWGEGKRKRAWETGKGKEKALFSPFSRLFPAEGASAEERGAPYITQAPATHAKKYVTRKSLASQLTKASRHC